MRDVLTIAGLCAELSGSPQTALLRNVSLTVREGEVHGLVGMSGAGKSMVVKSTLGILPSAVRITAGTIHFAGVDLLSASERQRRALMGQAIALIPQDPFTALNPSRRIEAQMTDVLRLKLGLSRAAAKERALALLSAVRIREPSSVLRRFPHELSGGMRQRVLIANAFALQPRLIIADEPTTALDVTIQKQILRLIRDLQVEHRTALLFVTHDLGVVAKICDTVSVIEAGLIIERASAAQIFRQPRHPFTRALFASIPRFDQPHAELHPVSQSVRAAVLADAASFDRRNRERRL